MAQSDSSAEHLRVLFDTIRDYAVMFLDPERRVLTWNTGAEDVLGYSKAVILGQSADTIFTPEDLAKGAPEREVELARTQGRVEDERWHLRQDGTRFFASGVLTPVLRNGSLQGYVKVLRDITERKQIEAAAREREARQTYLLGLSDALRDLSDPAAVQAAAVRVLGEGLDVDRAYYVTVDETQGEYVVEREWHRSGAPSHVRRYPLADWPMPWLPDGRPWVVRDVDTDPAMPENQRAAYRDNDIGACIVVPLVKRGKLVATLVVNQRVLRDWTREEVALVDETAERTWATVERAQSEAALRNSEARLLALSQASSEIHFRMSPDWSEMRELMGGGFLLDTNKGSRDWMENYIPGEDHPFCRSKIQEAIRTSGPIAFEHRVHRADGSLGWTATRAVPIFGPGREIIEWFGAASDITARKRAEEALRESEARFRLFVENVYEYALFQTDPEGKVTSWNPGAERLFGYSIDEMLGQSMDRLLTPADEQAGVFAREIARVLQGEHVEDARWVLRKDGTRFWAQWVTEPVRDEAGQLCAIAKVLRDETERKRAEERQRLLIGELNHRVKNTLATVQSIANQTLRRSTNPEEFAARFQGRIQALSRAHNLLTRMSWNSADLADIIREQLAIDGDNERISLEGPPAYLSAAASLALALVLHELGTNARKYGALSVALGRVVIVWRLSGEQDALSLHLDWYEEGGPLVRTPDKLGFGTILIEHGLAGVGGEAQLVFQPEGLRCHIQLPLASAITDEPKREA